MNEIISLVVKFLVAFASILITRYVVPAMKEYIKKMKNEEFYGIVKAFVEAAEQVFPEPKSGKNKNEYVKELAEAWISSNTKLSQEEVAEYSALLDPLIESFVHGLQDDK